MDYINNYIQRCESRGASNTTLNTYRTSLVRYCNYLKSKNTAIEDTREKEWIEYIAYLKEQGLKSNTIRHHSVVLKGFLAYLNKQGVVRIDTDELQIYRAGKAEVVVLNRRDIENIVSKIEGTGIIALRDRAIIELMANTGIRASELCALRRDALELNREGYVSIVVKGKGEKQRIVFCSPRIKSIVDIYLNTRNDSNDALFLAYGTGGTNHDKPLDRASLYYMVKRRAEKAGYKDVGCHTLRHYFCTSLLNKGMGIEVVRAIMGHESIATTQQYTHLSVEQNAEAYKQIMD